MYLSALTIADTPLLSNLYVYPKSGCTSRGSLSSVLSIVAHYLLCKQCVSTTVIMIPTLI